MKCLPLLLFCFCLQVISYAQERKVKWFVDYGIGASNFIGKGAYHNTYMITTVPAENTHTYNPFGKKAKLALSAGVSAQLMVNNKNGILALVDFAKLGSNVKINGISFPLRPSIIFPARGTTSVLANAISVSLNGFKIIGTTKTGKTYFLLGILYSKTVYVNEKGEATENSSSAYYPFQSDTDYKMKSFMQLQTGVMADVYRFRFGLQYRLAVNGIENPALNNGERIRPQSLLLKTSYLLFQ